MSQLTFRPPEASDQPAILAIDQAGLETGHASFRADPYSWDGFEAAYLGARGFAVLAETDGKVAAWAGVARISERAVYSGVGEVSIYVAPPFQGHRIGRALLREVIRQSEQRGYWSLQASIFPENEASLAIHHACDFRRVGRRDRIGRMSYGPMEGQWRDTLLLERRSSVMGSD